MFRFINPEAIIRLAGGRNMLGSQLLMQEGFRRVNTSAQAAYSASSEGQK
ncbi:MAG: hypothetical protein ACWGOX_08000 [Desulforhopalus sp.]